MTKEHLNTQLYWKLHREHESFRNWLLTQPPGVIIANAYKNAMMEDALLCFENNDLSDNLALALLRSSEPLENIFAAWEARGSGHMDSMWEKAQEYATEMAKKQARIKDRGR